MHNSLSLAGNKHSRAFETKDSTLLAEQQFLLQPCNQVFMLNSVLLQSIKAAFDYGLLTLSLYFPFRVLVL